MLARLIKASKEKDQGFTLIELLVVIVIIGILAAIAIPLFLNQQKKGVDAGMRSDVKNAATTVETYMTDPGAVLADDADMVEDLVAAAVNDAVRRVEETTKEKFAGLTGGMGLPPGMKLSQSAGLTT